MSYQEIGEFLSNFNSSSYNRSQIGNDRTTIARIYDFLKRLNLSKEDIAELITNISYLRKEELNIPLFLEILSRSLGYINEYKLSTIIKKVKDIHDIYIDTPYISIDEYIHLIEIDRIKKLFLTKTIKDKKFNIDCISDLKFAAAIELNQKEYADFISYIETNNQTQLLISFSTYIKLRDKIAKESRLYWDIYFGNEYLVLLTKSNIPFEDIFNKEVIKRKRKEQIDPVQLDLFSIDDYDKEELDLSKIDLFQISYIYDSRDIPYLENEKDLLKYYNNLIEGKKFVVLPKYKGYSNNQYIFNTK